MYGAHGHSSRPDTKGNAVTLAETEEAPFSASRASKIRRASWNLIDQVLSAATNVLLSFLVARNVSANEFGAFSVAFLLFSLMIGVSRALVGTPLSIRHSGESGEVRRATARAAFGTVLTVTLAASALLLLAGLIWRATLGPTLIALAVVLPFLILQDTCRMSFFAWAQPKLAALNDAIWAVLQLTFVLVLVRSGHVSAPVMVLAWGVAAAPASIVGMFQLRAVPIFGRVRAWIYETRGIVGYLLAEYIVGIGTFQGGLLLIGGLLGLSDIGSLRAAQILLGPLGIVATATMTFGVPEVARHGRLPRRAVASALAISGLLVAVAIVYTGLLLLIPQNVGVQLLGQTWAGARSVLLPVAAASIFASGKLGPAVLLYGRGLMRATFRMQVTLAAAAVVFMSVGAYLGGIHGLAWGTALAQAVVVPLWFFKLRTVVHVGEKRFHGQQQRVVLLDLLSWSSFASWGPALHRQGLKVLRVSKGRRWYLDAPLRLKDRIQLGAWPLRVDETGFSVVTPELMGSLFQAPTVDLHASEDYMDVALRTETIPLGSVSARVPDLERQRLLYDKLTMTEFAKSQGCDVPHTWAEASGATYPLVVKKRAGAGGLSVRLIDSPDQLTQAELELDPDNEGDLFYQEAVPGDGVNIGGVAHNGRIVVSAIYRAVPPADDPLGPPEWLRLVDSPEIQRDVEILLAALDYTGVFCLDFLVRSDGSAALIDFNSRIFGAWLPLQVAGIDLVGAYASLFGLAEPPQVASLPAGDTMLRNRLTLGTGAKDLDALSTEWSETRAYLRAVRPVTGRSFTAMYWLRGRRELMRQRRALR